jgi:hypothetical protein
VDLLRNKKLRYKYNEVFWVRLNTNGFDAGIAVGALLGFLGGAGSFFCSFSFGCFIVEEE